MSASGAIKVVVPEVKKLTSQAQLDLDNDDAYDLTLTPTLTVDDNTLKPSLTFFTRSKSISTRTYVNDTEPFFDHYVAFQFTANSGINVSNFENPLESSEEIISEYVADGGNIDFDLAYRIDYKKWDVALGLYYSLLSTDAVATAESSSEVINVDAEVYGFSAFVSYDFNGVLLYSEYRTFDTSDEGQNPDFTSILDKGDAVDFGVAIPLSVFSEDSSVDRKLFYLTLARTTHSEVDRTIFRLSVQKRFDFQ